VALRLCVGVALFLPTSNVWSQEGDSEIDRALSDSNHTWHSFAAAGVRVYYQPGSFAERHRVMLLRSAQAAVESALAFLELDADSLELRVIYLDDREQMQQLIGHAYSGYADWTGHGVFLVCNPEWRSFDTHEITHVLSMGRWGPSDERSSWMIEGLPIAVDGWCQSAAVDPIASFLVATGHWPGLAAFTADPRALGEIAGGVLAASLIRHLRARYGAPVVEEAWRSGLEAALKAQQLDPTQVEADWLDSLRTTANPLSEDEWEELTSTGCG